MKIYNQLCEEFKKECDEMVERGELSQEEANFRYFMGVDEILWDMPEELFEEDEE